MPRASKHSGFTLTEMAIVIGVVGILAAGAVIRFADLSVTRDANAVRAAQASLQTVVSQGSTRLDVAPSQLFTGGNLAITRNAFSDYISGASSGISITTFTNANNIQIRIPTSGRQANFIVTNGNVRVSALSTVNQGWGSCSATGGQISCP